MRKIKILLTTVGCPGAITMIHALKDREDAEVEIIGTDMNPEAAGKTFCDAFHTVPAGSDPSYPDVLADLAERYDVDLLFPQSSSDVMALSPYYKSDYAGGRPLLMARQDSVQPCDDKALMYRAFAGSSIKLPDVISVQTADEFRQAALDLGYPKRKLCFKPAVSKGSRGFRILAEDRDPLGSLLGKRIEESTMTLEDSYEILSRSARFPDLLVCEFMEGEEVTYDAFCEKGEILLGFTKTREKMRAGLAMYFQMVGNPEFQEMAKEIIRILDYDYFINIQFKGGKLMEINPRVSTFVHQENVNIPRLAVDYILGDITREQLMAQQTLIRSTRKTIRYYDQIFYDGGEYRV